MKDIGNMEIKSFIYNSEQIMKGETLESIVDKFIKDKYYNERIHYIKKFISETELLSLSINPIKTFQTIIVFEVYPLDHYENQTIECEIDKDYKFIIRPTFGLSDNNNKFNLSDLEVFIDGEYIQDLQSMFSGGHTISYHYINKCLQKQMPKLKEFLFLDNEIHDDEQVMKKLCILMSSSIIQQKIIRLNNILELNSENKKDIKPVVNKIVEDNDESDKQILSDEESNLLVNWAKDHDSELHFSTCTKKFYISSRREIKDGNGRCSLSSGHFNNPSICVQAFKLKLDKAVSEGTLI